MSRELPRVTVVRDPSQLPLFARSATPRQDVTSVPTSPSGAPASPVDWWEEARANPSSTSHGPAVDWALVAALRSAASERLMRAIEGDQHLTPVEQQALGRRIIGELLAEEARQSASSGRGAVDRREESALAHAVFDALFRLGRLQPLVDDPKVENVTILGHEDVWLEYEDGRLVRGPAVADSDAELVDFLVFLASRSEVNARQFSEAEPRLHLRLDGGARLAATAWVTPRPSVVIRR
ncbi:MAG TPA: hypothetical protein VLS51_07105, partial [Propionibacteriaceae bacterium]|nr:hypothetical protein [Propionibacteriaceae bacterium]